MNASERRDRGMKKAPADRLRGLFGSRPAVREGGETVNGYFPVCLLEKGRGGVTGLAAASSEARRSGRGAERRTTDGVDFVQKESPLPGSQAFASQMASAGIGADGVAGFDSPACNVTARVAETRRRRGRKVIREVKIKNILKFIKNIINVKIIIQPPGRIVSPVFGRAGTISRGRRSNRASIPSRRAGERWGLPRRGRARWSTIRGRGRSGRSIPGSRRRLVRSSRGSG